MSAAQHTPGPWEWFERMPGRPYLATPDRGQLYVMGFERKGMQGAGPVFSHWPGIEGGAQRERKGGIMEPGLLLRDGSIHPDARLIAAAPDLLAALEELLTDMVIAQGNMRHAAKRDQSWEGCAEAIEPRCAAARAAIAKATGEQT